MQRKIEEFSKAVKHHLELYPEHGILWAIDQIVDSHHFTDELYLDISKELPSDIPYRIDYSADSLPSINSQIESRLKTYLRVEVKY